MDSDAERTLLAVLRDREAAAVTTLAETLDAHPITIDRRCYELQRDGYIRQTSKGIYAITGAGEDRLETQVNEG